MKIKLSDIPNDTPVTVTNIAWGEDDEGTCFWQCNGKLEKTIKPGGNHYVRVKECYNGSSGVSFLDRHVREIEKLSSGRLVITVR